LVGYWRSIVFIYLQKLENEMNILFITHKFPPTIGGMEKHSFELLHCLKKKHTVHELIYDNQEGRGRFFFLLKKRVKKILQKYPNIDIIYLNDALLANVAIGLKQFTSIPIVSTFHGLDVVFPNSFYQKKILPKLWNLDAVISVSEATAQACRERGFDNQKVFAVKNGIDHDIANHSIRKDFLTFFQKKYNLNLEGKKILVTMGRPVRRKGFSWFIENVLPNLDEDVLFLLVGPRKGGEPLFLNFLPKKIKHEIQLMFGMGSDENKINTLLENPVLQKKAIQLGKLPFDEILELISVSDLFVMPNIKVAGDAEGFGLVALEAAIRATPVVAAGIEGITDAIEEGKNGFLLPSKNSNAWVKKISELLLKKDQLLDLGIKGKDYTLGNFSWEMMADGYTEVFEKVLLENSTGNEKAVGGMKLSKFS